MSSKPLFHCNKYVNMDIDQAKDVHTESSEERVERMEASEINSLKDIKSVLGNSDGDLQIFRTMESKRDVLITLATGTDA